MNKMLKIFLSIVGLSLTYLWVCSMFQSCNSNSDKSADDLAMLDDLDIGEEEIIDVSDEDFFEEDDSYEDSGTEESFEVLEEQLVEKPTSTAPARTSNTAAYSGGSYLLISGNYLVKGNADEMVKKLKSLGYSAAEIVVFDRSQYHTVIASRFSSYETALQSASMLKQKGVDCYVKKRS